MTDDIKDIAKATQEELAASVEAMKAEIAELKDALAEKEHQVMKKMPDMEKVKATFREGYNKISEAVKPILDQADVKLGEPAREAMHKVEKNITVHPLASVAVALGAGLVIGKLLDIMHRASIYTGDGD